MESAAARTIDITQVANIVVLYRYDVSTSNQALSVPRAKFSLKIAACEFKRMTYCAIPVALNVNSPRRLIACPALVELSAIGLSSPIP